MTKHLITKVTEPAGDGSVDVHVTDRHPFHLPAAQLAAMPVNLEQGAYIVDENNRLSAEEATDDSKAEAAEYVEAQGLDEEETPKSKKKGSGKD